MRGCSTGHVVNIPCWFGNSLLDFPDYYSCECGEVLQLTLWNEVEF